ncbi:MAG: chorismate synthase [Chlorobi bacterium]|nr:chorismate synthase [Chlorobiota bacterium]
MSGNSFGNIFTLTSFGESHGKAIGGIIDGCPAGINIDYEFIQSELNRRKPGQSALTTSRNESDKIEFLSGIFNGKSLGTPIGFVVWNKEKRSEDYSNIKDIYRPSHADFTYEKKYGIRDYRGGGRSSARETIARVVAGALAKLVLINFDIKVKAYVRQIGNIEIDKDYSISELENIEENILKCPDETKSEEMQKLIIDTKNNGDSLGGIIHCVIEGMPVGIGEPVFNKLHAVLGKAMLSINAVKGIEFGSGFKAANMYGSEHNDAFFVTENKIKTKTNFSGGIQGGISNGEPVYFNVAFKPTASITGKQSTVNKNKEVVEMKIAGRHDPCVLPRAVPIVESMAAMVILDFLLLQNAYKF